MTIEISRAEWLLLWAALPLWWQWIRPDRDRGLMVARFAEAESLALRDWTGRALEALPHLMRGLAVACVVVALAGPRLVKTHERSVTEGVGIVLAVDLSTSMWAEDMADGTTRLAVAKEALQRFLDRRVDDFGVVAFAGEAYTRLPLTHDRYVAKAAVEGLEVGLLIDGTDVAGAIAAGAGLLRDSPHDSKVLVLVTDGAHNRAGLEPALAARAAATHDIRIFSVAIGTDAAAGVGTANMETVLARAAAITNGGYFRATDVATLERIYAEIDRLTTPSERLVADVEVIPLGAWPLVVALVLTVLGGSLRASRWGVVP